MRRVRSPLTLVMIGVLLALSFVLYFHRVFLHREVLVPADLLYIYAPWSAMNFAERAHPQNPILVDDILEFYPWRSFTAERFREGYLPLWNGWNFFGHPFLALSQSMVLYPFQAMVLGFPPNTQPLLLAIIHTVIAFWGMYLLLRRYGCLRGAASLAGFAYTFGGFMILWQGHPHSKVAAWLPWLFLGLERLLAKPRLSGFSLLAVVTYLQFAAGHVETSLHILTGLVLFGLLRYGWLAVSRSWTPTHTAGALLTVAAVGTGTMMHAATLIPLAEYLENSAALQARQHGVPVQPYLSPDLMLAQIIPRAFGAEFEGTYWRNEGNINEVASGYIGVLPLVLAALAFVNRRRLSVQLMYLTLVLFAFGISYGWPVIYPLTQLVPIFRMSYNFRYTLLSAFSLAVLGGLGFDAIGQRRGAVSMKAGLPVLLVTGGALCGLAIVNAPNYARVFMGRENALGLVAFMQRQQYTFFMFLLMSGVLLFTAIWARPRSQPTALLSLSILMLDLYLMGHLANPTAKPNLAFPRGLPSIEFLRRAPVPSRFLGLSHALPPHLNMLYGLEDVRGNDALSPRYQDDFLCLMDPEIRRPGILPALRQLTVSSYKSVLGDPVGIDFLVTDRMVGLPEAGDHRLRLVFNDDLMIYRNQNSLGRAAIYSFWRTFDNPGAVRDAWEIGDHDLFRQADLCGGGVPGESPEAAAPAIRAEVTSWDHHRVTIHATAPGAGMLVVNQTWFPGWEARLNGVPVPIVQANLCMAGVAVPGGESGIELLYRPVSFRIGLFLSLVAAAIVSVTVTLDVTRRAVHSRQTSGTRSGPAEQPA